MSSRLLIEYDGTGFSGWARQPGRRTVQGELESALATILRRDVALTVAGRTDAGVHARGQVASHSGDPAPGRRLNGLLPRDVRVLSSEAADKGFDARRDALSRGYRYRLFTRRADSALDRHRALHWPHRLDRSALDACAAAIVGTHDFTAFTPDETRHTRFEREVLSAEWRDAGEHSIELWIEADTFMRHMVRTLVGTMLTVAGGRATLDSFATLLEGRPRRQAGETAPPHGLCLEYVRY